MLSKLIPQEGKFFVLFDQHADVTVEAALRLQAMMGDLGNAEKYAREIKDLEHRADSITHETLKLLHKTFITPIDRDEIHGLIKALDDVVDIIDAVGQRMNLFGVKQASPAMRKLADLVVACARVVKRSMSLISNLKEVEELLKTCVEIHAIENQGDTALHEALASLFRDETDIKRLIMEKEIVELLERVTDQCEVVANRVEGIVLEYA